MTAVPAIDGLQEGFQNYLREGHFLADSPELVPLTLALYRRLAKGKPVERTQLADDLSLSLKQVNALLSELPASTIDADERGNIIAFGGLSLGPANHVFRIDGLELHTWCVFDALFLPQLLGKSATSITRCPTTDARIEIALNPDAVSWSKPADPVMSIVAPDKESCCENLRGAFCNHVNFFVDENAFRAWAAGRPEVGHVSLKAAHGLAQQRNLYRYGDQF